MKRVKNLAILFILFLVSACSNLGQNNTPTPATTPTITKTPTQTQTPTPTLTPTPTPEVYSLEKYNALYAVRSIVISDNGKKALILSEDQNYNVEVFIWDITTPNQPLLKVKTNLLDETAATLSHDGDRLAISGCAVQTAKAGYSQCQLSEILIFDVTGQEIIYEFSVELQFGIPILNLLFSSSGEELVYYENGSFYSIIDLETKTVVERLIRSYKGFGTNSSVISPTKPIIAVAVYDGIEIWDLKTHEQVRLIEGSFTSSYFPGAVTFNSQGNKLVFTGCTATGFEFCAEESITIYDANAQKTLSTLPRLPYVVTAISFSPDETVLAYGTRSQGIYLWRLETSQLIQVEEFSEIRVSDIEFTPDGKTLIIGGNTGLHLFDLSETDF